MSLESGKMSSMNTILLFRIKGWWLSQGKALMQLFELHAELVRFWTEYHCYLKEWKNPDKLWLFRLRYSADIFSKRMKWACQLISEKQTGIVVLSKITFKHKSELWKTYNTMSLRASNTSKSFFMSLVVILMKMVF